MSFIQSRTYRRFEYRKKELTFFQSKGNLGL